MNIQQEYGFIHLTITVAGLCSLKSPLRYKPLSECTLHRALVSYTAGYICKNATLLSEGVWHWLVCGFALVIFF